MLLRYLDGSKRTVVITTRLRELDAITTSFTRQCPGVTTWLNDLGQDNPSRLPGIYGVTTVSVRLRHGIRTQFTVPGQLTRRQLDGDRHTESISTRT